MKKTKSFLYLLGFFLICILLFFFVLYHYTTRQLNSSLSNSAENQLSFAYQRLEDKSSEIELLTASIMMENDVRYFSARLDDEASHYEYVQNLKRIKDMIRQRMQNASGVEAIHLYWPEDNLLISTKAGFSLDEEIIEIPIQAGEKWSNQQDRLSFSLSYPYLNREQQAVEFIVYTEMKPSFLNDIRKSVTTLEKSNALLELPDGYIMYESSNIDHDVVKEMTSMESEKIDKKEVTIDNEDFRVLSRSGKRNQIKIISYYDVGNLMRPIKQINGLTFISTFSVLFIGLLLIYVFYKNIFTQIGMLIRQFKNVENGDLEVVLPTKTNSEFDYVFDQFNQMVRGIDRLLNSLEKEYHLRDLAERKQLQAQINPHFLYNSLFYIVSMADNPEAVREMTMHLADYYQYRTETKDLVSLEEEIDFAHAYLSIISLRKQISYQINVETDISDIEVLPLLIQPLLENAIQHGIDKKEGAHQVILSIKKVTEGLEVSVSDDGNGLLESERSRLLDCINHHSSSNQSSIGLKNINQRLVNYYGKNSTLKIEREEELGGLKVSFVILKEDSDEIVNSG
ncbi:sensor histidine kinase [Jeotgalibaca ciconiae]|uniref:HAMP domain-containing protein n=1 Tax=Jeotgalibaca ciconiae TaxID=2496265 RepID=A0A3Q9BL67_9LACT|nr:histidine kinase [Jeotgalibaca ciconiae]AZP03559.1 HAMP domain-containing protein [Jeotgalibaca ciconiae]